MSLRIRENGRVLCAAMHDEEPGDVYLHDGISYRLTVELGLLVTESMHQNVGRGGHAKHGEWWWRDQVPADVVPERLFESHKSMGPLRPASANEIRAMDELLAFFSEEQVAADLIPSSTRAGFFHFPRHLRLPPKRKSRAVTLRRKANL